MGSVTVDFVAQGEDRKFWIMVLVEEGPWELASLESNLKRLQARLYDCIDVALDGQLAAKFPESKGKPVQIRVDGYNLPESEVRAFFARFTEAALELPDYSAALAASSFVKGISFELNLEPLKL